jgi:hypothetical protein
MTNNRLIATNVESARTAWRLYLRYRAAGLPHNADFWRKIAKRLLRTARQLKQDARK